MIMSSEKMLMQRYDARVAYGGSYQPRADKRPNQGTFTQNKQQKQQKVTPEEEDRPPIPPPKDIIPNDQEDQRPTRQGITKKSGSIGRPQHQPAKQKSPENQTQRELPPEQQLANQHLAEKHNAYQRPHERNYDEGIFIARSTSAKKAQHPPPKALNTGGSRIWSPGPGSASTNFSYKIQPGTKHSTPPSPSNNSIRSNWSEQTTFTVDIFLDNGLREFCKLGKMVDQVFFEEKDDESDHKDGNYKEEKSKERSTKNTNRSRAASFASKAASSVYPDVTPKTPAPFSPWNPDCLDCTCPKDEYPESSMRDSGSKLCEACEYRRVLPTPLTGIPSRSELNSPTINPAMPGTMDLSNNLPPELSMKAKAPSGEYISVSKTVNAPRSKYNLTPSSHSTQKNDAPIERREHHDRGQEATATRDRGIAGSDDDGRETNPFGDLQDMIVERLRAQELVDRRQHKQIEAEEARKPGPEDIVSRDGDRDSLESHISANTRMESSIDGSCCCCETVERNENVESSSSSSSQSGIGDGDGMAPPGVNDDEEQAQKNASGSKNSNRRTDDDIWRDSLIDLYYYTRMDRQTQRRRSCVVPVLQGEEEGVVPQSFITRDIRAGERRRRRHCSLLQQKQQTIQQEEEQEPPTEIATPRPTAKKPKRLEKTQAIEEEEKEEPHNPTKTTAPPRSIAKQPQNPETWKPAPPPPPPLLKYRKFKDQSSWTVTRGAQGKKKKKRQTTTTTPTTQQQPPLHSPLPPPPSLSRQGQLKPLEDTSRGQWIMVDRFGGRVRNRYYYDDEQPPPQSPPPPPLQLSRRKWRDWGGGWEPKEDTLEEGQWGGGGCTGE